MKATQWVCAMLMMLSAVDVLGFQTIRLEESSGLHLPTLVAPLPIQFEEVASDVFRQGYFWRTAEMQVSTYAFMVKYGNDYIMVDAGAPEEAAALKVMEGVRKILGTSGKLRLILVTHGHLDHVGALESLLLEYPEAQVIFHELEAPFLTGEGRYANLSTDNPDWKFPADFVELTVPSSRILLLSGSEGDVADAVPNANVTVNWSVPRGLLTFYLTPGHTPGHVIFHHTPSDSLLVGDLFVYWHSPPVMLPPPIALTSNLTEAKSSIESLEQIDFTTVFATHENAEGISRQVVLAYCEALGASGASLASKSISG